jgi:hypothetical protein
MTSAKWMAIFLQQGDFMTGPPNQVIEQSFSLAKNTPPESRLVKSTNYCSIVGCDSQRRFVSALLSAHKVG